MPLVQSVNLGKSRICYTPSPLTDRSWWQRITKKDTIFCSCIKKRYVDYMEAHFGHKHTRIMETAEVPCMLQCGERCNPATNAIGSIERWESIRQSGKPVLKCSYWELGMYA